MKRIILLAFCLGLIQSGIASGQKDGRETTGKDANTVTVSTVPETESLTAKWIEGFRNGNPGTEVRIVPSGQNADAEIRFLTDHSAGSAGEKADWHVIVGREVIVPVTGTANRYLTEIQSAGFSPEKFLMILSSEGNLYWGQLLYSENNVPVSAWMLDDESVSQALSRFTGTEPGLIKASIVESPDELIAQVKSNPDAMAFCRLSDITDATGMSILPGIAIIPVDINNNGLSEYFEQFYSDYSSFSRGVYIGKYPKALCNNIYAVAETVPAPGAQSDLVRYILADGQRYVAGAGFSPLARGEGIARSETMVTDQTIITAGSDGTSPLRGWLWVIAVIVAVSAVAIAMYYITRAVAEVPVAPVRSHMSAFSLKSLVTPAGILFDKGHTWAFMERNGIVKVGIDDFLQHITGPITRVKMKSPGEKVRKGEYVLSLIQKGKQLNIKSPVSGTIVTRNERLLGDSDIVNSSPYDEGWIYAIEPENWEKDSRLLNLAGKYADYLKEEFARIRDLLSVMPGINDVRYAHVVLQDGGELKDGLLEEFGPEIWEEFQARFLEMPR